ncbi:RNA polymerase III transcription initiation factor complex subunit [Apophysomyces sp. BC1015]|nr:RNA polymerase III transcription initiation factor complex subunit [Apophysomyces sp. BC1015]
MIDSLLSATEEEFCYDSGCDLEQLWTFVQSAAEKYIATIKPGSQQKFILDDKYKAYLWDSLRSCESFHITANNVDVANVSYNEICTKYDSVIRIISSAEKQMSVVLKGVFPGYILSSVQIEMLQAVARSRYNGITQNQLAEMFSMDPRQIFHHLKRLQQAKVIIKRPAVQNGTYTNLCLHTQFAADPPKKETLAKNRQKKNDSEETVGSDGSFQHDIVLKKLTQLLTDARNNMMALSDLITALAKYVEKINVSTETQRHLRCVRLIKQPEEQEQEAKRQVSEFVTMEHIDDKPFDFIPRQSTEMDGIPIGLPMEYTMYRHIEIEDLMPGVAADSIRAALKLAIEEAPLGWKQYQIYTAVETAGRSHQYRYFSKNGWIKNQQKQGLQIDLTMDQDIQDEENTEESESIYHHVLEHEKLARAYPGGGRKRALVETVEQKKRRRQSKLAPAPSKATRGRKRKATEDMTEPADSEEIETQCQMTKPSQVSEDHKTSPRRKDSPSADDMNIASVPTSWQSPIATPTVSDNSKSSTTPTNINDSPAPKSLSSTPKRPKRPVNTTTEKRRKLLLSMVLERRIIEANSELMMELTQSEGPEAKHKIARTTLTRLAESLHDAGAIRVIKTVIPTLSGSTGRKTLLLHPDLCQESEEVQNYLKQAQQIKLVKGGSKHSKLKTVHTDVQRSGQDQMTSTPQPSWHSIALQYGWIPSKWLRAKELHLYMLRMMLREAKNVTGDRPEVRKISTKDLVTDFITSMPLRFLFKVIGIFRANEVLATFLGSNNVEDMTLGDVGPDMKLEFTGPYFARRLRAILRTLLIVLKALGLIEPIIEHTEKEQPAPDIAPVYYLCDTGNIRDFTKPDRPILQQMRLDSIEDAVDYWSELQVTCTQIHDDDIVAYDSVSGSSGDDCLNRISKASTWGTGLILSEGQRRQLDVHVDPSKGEAPFDDRLLCKKLSRETGLPPDRIKRYFKAIVAAHENKMKMINRKKTETKKPKQSGEIQTQAVSALMRVAVENRKVSSSPKELKSKVCFVQPTFVGSRNVLRRKVYAQAGETWRGPYEEKQWTDVERRVLLHAYSIMQYRAKETLFYWNPIVQVLPNRSPEDCRHLWLSMRHKQPKIHAQVRELQEQWAIAYEKGLSSKVIMDERPWDTKNYDLAGYLEHFLAFLINEPISDTSPILLPKNTDMFARNFVVCPPRTKDGWEAKNLLMRPHVLDANREGRLDEVSSLVEEETENKSALLLTVIIKMIMITPHEHYNRMDAFSLLRSYPSEQIDEAIEMLYCTGAIIKKKIEGARNVSGRQINISEKFLKTFSGPMHYQFFSDAVECHQSLTSPMLVPDTISAGLMGCMLNLISQNKLVIGMDSREQYLRRRQGLSYPKLRYASLCDQWIRKDMYLRLHVKGQLKSAVTKQTRSEKLSRISQNEAQQVLLGISEREQLAQEVYMALESFKERGATLSEIKRAVNIKIPDADICRCLEIFQSYSPPLAVEVGYRVPRIVATEHAAQWLVKSTPSNDGAYYMPRMWCDLHGNTVDAALGGCADTILGHILLTPGVSQATLRDKFAGFLTICELRDVLNHLVNAGAIRRTVVQQVGGRASLFSKAIQNTAIGIYFNSLLLSG